MVFVGDDDDGRWDSKDGKAGWWGTRDGRGAVETAGAGSLLRHRLSRLVVPLLVVHVHVNNQSINQSACSGQRSFERSSVEVSRVKIFPPKVCEA